MNLLFFCDIQLSCPCQCFSPASLSFTKVALASIHHLQASHLQSGGLLVKITNKGEQPYNLQKEWFDNQEDQCRRIIAFHKSPYFKFIASTTFIIRCKYVLSIASFLATAISSAFLYPPI